MSFSKFFRKKGPDPSTPKMKSAHSLDDIKDYTRSSSCLEKTEHPLSTQENRLDDISVHVAVSKYSKQCSRCSQLSKSLPETLSDKDALAYFIQFLESKSRANLIKFLLDVHAFQTCFQNRLMPSGQYAASCPISSNEDWSADLDCVIKPTNHKPQTEVDSTHYANTNGVIDGKTKNEIFPDQSSPNCIPTTNGSDPAPGNPEESLWEDMLNDAMLIFGKYFSPESRLCLGVPDELRDSVARQVCHCRDDQSGGLSCFDNCKDRMLKVLEREYYPLYLQSSYHCKHQLDILTGNFLTITDVIYHETSLSYFTEFMEQCRCIDYLQCFLDVDNFQHHFSDLVPGYDPRVAQEDAMIVYDKFFSLQALRPLNLGDGVRLEVEGAICREGGPLPDCFLLPRSLLLYKMEQDHLPKFLKSDLYYKYLVDLINTVHASKDIPAYHRKRTSSDASSEKSFETVSSNSVSSRNTLLAMDTLGKNSRKSGKTRDSMQIDGSLLDPNNLWHRPNTSMKLGHVNSLGQFIPEFEPEPDHEKKKKFGFSLFSKSSKSEEDLAIQIAQQIIQDVNILTNYASTVDDDDDAVLT